jgi:SAM-dependent methyltransferase
MSAAPAEVFASALVRPAGHNVRFDDGTIRAIPLARWLAPASEVDRRVLARARGPVLDVGCGPGRHVRALAQMGILALGVDISAGAVRLARERGAAVHEASVFDSLPGEGSWACALLLDGNLGIGGRPERLLRRVSALLARDGHVLVETEPAGTATRSGRARLEGPGGDSTWFPWAVVSADGLASLAAAAGMQVVETWQDGGRWFAALR